MSACHARYGNYGCPYYNCQDLTKTLNDTVWLATFSHAIAEGGAGERAYTSRSTDEGKTWTMMQPLEASLQLASHGSGFIKGSTAVPLTRNANRVYVVYQYNSDNTTTLPDGTKLNGRTDMLGKGFFIRWCGATPPHSHSHSTHLHHREARLDVVLGQQSAALDRWLTDSTASLALHALCTFFFRSPYHRFISCAWPHNTGPTTEG
jgi:hypothetical protein